MKTKTLLFFVAISLYTASYSCDESKTDTESTPFDLTPTPDPVVPSHFISQRGNNRPFLKKYHLRYNPDETDSDEEIYPFVPRKKADGSYNYIDETSEEFKKRKARVERTAATTRDLALKEEHFQRVSSCHSLCGFEKNPEDFCWKHYCKNKDCMRLFAYQAFLLETDYKKRQAYLLSLECDFRRIGPKVARREAEIHETGRLAVFQEVSPKSTAKKPSNIVRKILHRGIKG